METVNPEEIQSFISSFADSIIGLDVDALNRETYLDTLPQWDSLAVLVTITMVDEEYGVSLTGEDLQNCKTIGDIFYVINCRLS